MKKIVAIIGMVMLLAGIAFAMDMGGNPTWNTGNALIDTGPGVCDGFVVLTDGTNPVYITLYDNTASTGNVFWQTTIVTTSSSNRAQAISLSPPWRYSVGLYALMSSSGTFSYTVTTRKY